MAPHIHGPTLFPSIRERFQQAAKLAERLTRKEHFSLAFSACHHGAGTTTVALNFAAAMADGGKRVVLVEASFSRPQLREVLKLGPGPGSEEFLHGEASLDSVLQEHPGQPGLSVLAAGSRRPNPSTLLKQDSLARAMAQLTKSFDVVIFDTAPLIYYPNTIAISTQVDGIILVIEVERESREVVTHANNILKSAEVSLLGAVLNKKRFYIPEWIYRLL